MAWLDGIWKPPRQSEPPVTQKQFFTSLTITWLYILVLVGKSITETPGPIDIGLFIGALAMYLGQVVALLKVRKTSG